MSRSNPMHHDSNLHPIFQQALAPFAPKFPPLTKRQQSALDNYDFNIRMFESYGERYAERVEQMREERRALISYFAGEIKYLDLPYSAREALADPIPPEYLGS